MIIIVIIGGILAGWVIGNPLIDKWVNRGIEEVEDERD